MLERRFFLTNEIAQKNLLPKVALDVINEGKLSHFAQTTNRTVMKSTNILTRSFRTNERTQNKKKSLYIETRYN